MRYTLLLLTLVIGSSAFAQEIVFQKKIKLRGEKRSALPVYDEAKGATHLFLVDNDSITGIDINTQDDEEGIIAHRPPNRYSNVLGYSISNGKYNIFYSNASNTGFAVSSFDFTSRTAEQRLSSAQLKGERFIAAASYRNKLYVLSVRKGTSTIRLYIFEDADKFEVKTYSFEGKKFYEPPKSTIDHAISYNAVSYVDNAVPNSLDMTSSPNKLYAFDNKLVLTFDNIFQYTAVISIDLNSFQERLVFYNHQRLTCTETRFMQANSYIYKNQLYQFSACPSGFVFSVLDIPSNTILKKYTVEREEDISIANTPIKQEGNKSPYAASERELSKTKQFLRKVSHGNAGVAVASGPNGVQVTLGSSETITAGGAPGVVTPGMPAMNVGPSGMIAIPARAPGFNPVYNNFMSYTGTFSVYIKCLFDPGTFEHREGEIADNAFDVITKYLKSIEPTPDQSKRSGEGPELTEESIRARTVFKRGSDYILGYYDRRTKYYVLRKFEGK